MANLKISGGPGESQALALPRGDRPIFLVAAQRPGTLEIRQERPARYLAALLHTAGHWVVLVPPEGGDLAIDGLRVPACKILDDDSILEVGGLQARLMEKSEKMVGPDDPLLQQGKACPWCQAPFAAGDVVTYCPICDLAQHSDCLKFYRKCGSLIFCGYTLPDESPQEKAITNA